MKFKPHMLPDDFQPNHGVQVFFAATRYFVTYVTCRPDEANRHRVTQVHVEELQVEETK